MDIRYPAKDLNRISEKNDCFVEWSKLQTIDTDLRNRQNQIVNQCKLQENLLQWNHLISFEKSLAKNGIIYSFIVTRFHSLTTLHFNIGRLGNTNNLLHNFICHQYEYGKSNIEYSI